MSTPEKPRPSLDDTLARIDQALAEPERERCATERVTRNPAGEVISVPCQMQALPGTYRCRFHTDKFGPDPKPGAYLSGLKFDVRPQGGVTENGQVTPWPPYLKPALDEAARQSAAQLAATVERRNAAHLPGAPGPTCPGCAADTARPGWLARALHRLFT